MLENCWRFQCPGRPLPWSSQRDWHVLEQEPRLWSLCNPWALCICWWNTAQTSGKSRLTFLRGSLQLSSVSFWSSFPFIFTACPQPIPSHSNPSCHSGSLLVSKLTVFYFFFMLLLLWVSCIQWIWLLRVCSCNFGNKSAVWSMRCSSQPSPMRTSACQAVVSEKDNAGRISQSHYLPVGFGRCLGGVEGLFILWFLLGECGQISGYGIIYDSHVSRHGTHS